ncbi:hypothetical protein SHIRM173S_01267 [Streptomyces hirsutus]
MGGDEEFYVSCSSSPAGPRPRSNRAYGLAGRLPRRLSADAMPAPDAPGTVLRESGGALRDGYRPAARLAG